LASVARFIPISAKDMVKPMNLFRQSAFVCVLGVGLTLVVAQSASAQRGRGVFGASRIQLATLEQVQAELKLTDEQKELVSEINEKLSEDRRELFQGGGGGGDFAAMREKMVKMNDEATAKLAEKLEDTQKTRLTELYIQVNGASTLSDKDVAEALKVTDEQKEALAEAQTENRESSREAFQNFRDMSDEERQEVMTKIRKESDARLLAALDDNQREQFEAMAGEKVEIDVSQLRRRGGRGGQGGGGNRGGNSDRPRRPE
jgi:DNA-binding MarR family transcriptional regulator